MVTSFSRFPLVFALGFAAVGCSAAAPDASSDSQSSSTEAVKTEATGTATQDLAFVWPSKSRRIAVVGAGPSGLTAASTLKELGYKNVTVFEKESRVGGKVYSYRSPVGTTELGAVFASPDYTNVLGLAKKYNIPYETYANKQVILDENGVEQTAQTFLTSRYTTAQILAATAAYAGVLALFAPIQEDGLALVPGQSDLYLPFSDFAKKYGITPIAELVRSVMVGFGYAYYETTPAIYYMKLMGWLVKPSLTTGLEQATYYTFPTGFQSIWEAVATEQTVRLNSAVTSIVRPSPSGAPVQITINGTTKYDFDEVVISAPLNRVSSFMTLKGAEATLFPKMESFRYDVSIFSASGLGTSEAVFFHGNSNPSRINHVTAWANRAPESPFVGWQILQTAATPAQITNTLAEDIAGRGGHLNGVLLRQDWDYFPHVNTAALQGGFYYQVAALQGNNHTFYVGGGLNFETVEHSARQAQSLVKLHFPTAFLP